MRPNRLILSALTGASCWLMVLSTAITAADAEHPVVIIDTSAGPITVELDHAKAPISVENFLKYVDKGFYDGLIFHRVIKDFMIQGGGMIETKGILTEKDPIFPPIKNEGTNGLSNVRGTIAMARGPARDSATSQFYISHGDNSGSLDRGYAVFGKVIDGMKVVDEIAAVPITVKPFQVGGVTVRRDQDVPVKIVTIKSIKRKP